MVNTRDKDYADKMTALEREMKTRQELSESAIGTGLEEQKAQIMAEYDAQLKRLADDMEEKELQHRAAIEAEREALRAFKVKRKRTNK